MLFNHRHLLRAKDYNGQAVRYAQHKADGLRVLVTMRDHQAAVVTREGKTDFWPELRDNSAPWVRLIGHMPPWSALDCELHVPGVQATDIKTLIAARDSRLKLTPFAVPFYAGEDWRLEPTMELVTNLVHEGFEPVQTIELYDIPTRLDQDEVDTLIYQAAEAKLEGYVLKAAHYSGWYKIKPVRSVDCVVVDIEVSDSDTFCGGLKSLIVGVYDGDKLITVANVGSGFTVEYRKSVKLASLKGQVCEVSYDSLAGKGKLKFPRFVRWRDDKGAQECVMEQLK